MKPEVKEAWIKALRSGKYKQGKRCLRTGDGKFCCLGVLCDISGLGKWDYHNAYLGLGAILPEQVVEWAGLGEAHPNVRINGVMVGLAQLNDGEHTFKTPGGKRAKFGFRAIAALIEKNL